MEDEICKNGASKKSAAEIKSKAQQKKPPKEKALWWQADNFNLIRLVKNEPCLWDVNHVEHSNRSVRNQAWETVANGFDTKFDTLEVREHWNALKQKYLKCKKNGMVWTYLKKLAFTDCPRKRRVNSVPRTEYESEDSETDESYMGDSDEINERIVEDATTISAGATLPYSSAIISAVATLPHSSRTISPHATDTIFSTHGIPITPTANEPSTSVVSMSINHSNARDEALATFMLSELRSLAESDATILRCRLQRTMLDFSEEMQNNMSVDVPEVVEMKYSVP